MTRPYSQLQQALADRQRRVPPDRQDMKDAGLPRCEVEALVELIDRDRDATGLAFDARPWWAFLAEAAAEREAVVLAKAAMALRAAIHGRQG